MIIQNSNGIGTSLNVAVNDRSYRLRQIMGEDSLYLYFSMPNYTPIAVGAYVDYQATRYYLHKPDHFKKHHSRNYEYSLVLTSEIGSLSKYKMRDSAEKRLKFPFTAKPQQHLQMLVDNLNERENGWTVGACIDAPEKLISYNHTSLNEALQMIADAFETEWEVKDKTIHLKKVEYNHINPLALSYGKGNGFKPGIGRSNVDEKSAIEILHVQGGERNIDYSKYGNKELLMPIGQTYNYEGRTYVVSADGRSIQRSGKPIVTGVEDSLDAAHIYPQRVGEVSEVVVVNAAKHLYDFKDASIPANLDFNACQIAGEKMTVVFQTGMLAGREFDIDSYVHASRLFRIVPQEQDGMHLPDNIFKPVPTDKYAIFGIQLPAAYIRDDATKTGASWDLFKEAVKYFYEHETPRFTFTGELDGIWAKQDWLNIGGKIVLGGFVNFSDPQFFPAGELIRIVGVKDFVNNPYSPEIELSNTPISGGFMSEIGKIKAQEVVTNELHRQSISYAKRGYQDSIQTMEMLQEAFKDTFTNAISPVTVKTMALLVGDESLQFRFVNNTTTPVEVVHNVTFNPATKKLNAPAGIIQHMTLGLDTISSAHAPSEYKFWNVPNFDTPPLVSADKSYYLYIKANKANTTAIFYISESPIGLEAVAGYYHFLMGILNSESDDDRSYVSLYGFTEITPGRITTNKIVSADGNTFIDLQTGDIQGKFTFSSGKKIEDAITDQQIYIEYSVNGTTGWHTAFGTGDKYMRQKKGTGNWSSAIRLVGIDGTSGTDGRSVNRMTTEFYLSNSKTSQTGGSWVTEPPTWVNGKYLWTRVKIDYINPTSTAYTTPSVSSEWEAVNDLEIGGRNLLRNSSFEGTAFYTLATVNRGINAISDEYAYEGSKAWKCVTGGTTNSSGGYIQISGLEIGGTYTFSVHVMSLNATPVELRIITTTWGTVKGQKATLEAGIWQRVSVTFEATASTLRLSVLNGDYEYPTYYIDTIKLEKGTIATDWTPAPEDVDAKILSAKQEALTAAGNAQSTANSASSAVGNLSGYVDGAFKDGVIDAAEAKAIEKYKNTLNEAMAKAESSYLKVYTNTYLSGAPKTALQNAKINLWGQRDTLIGAINTAISGGTTTAAQKLAVDNAFTSFNSLMAAFQNALEEANKAIQVKLDNIAKGYVDDLEIGGRNLMLNSKGNNISGLFSNSAYLSAVVEDGYECIKLSFPAGHSSTYADRHLQQPTLDGAGEYTVSFWYKTEGEDVNNISFFNYPLPGYWILTLPKSSTWKRAVKTFSVAEGIQKMPFMMRSTVKNKLAGSYFFYRNFKFEKGSKATDWTPAPEDVTAEILSAKQEALTAAGNAQSTANSANTAVGTLSGYVDGAFKDGVIDAAEAKAIEKYKNTLNEAMAKAESSYLKVYTNTYLSGAPKTALQNAKINLWGQRDTLIGAINTAIAGGTTTAAQKLAVDNAFTSFNSLMAAFQNALEEANKAIQVKLDDIAKGYVDAIEVGGQNLALETNQGTKNWHWAQQVGGYTATEHIEDGVSGCKLTRNSTPHSGWNYASYSKIGRDKLERGETYMITFDVFTNKTSTLFLYFRAGNNQYELISSWDYKNNTCTANTWSRIVLKATLLQNFPPETNQLLYITGLNADTNAYYIFRNLKIEKGNNRTNWTPSPEDVPSALDYLATAIQDGSTDIEGGLVSTNVLKVKDTSGAVTGGMSGLSNDNVGFWTGGSYQDALNSLAKVLFRKDGSGQLSGGLIKFSEIGQLQVGDFDVDPGGTLLIKEGTENRVMLTKSNVSTLADIAATAQNSTATVLAHLDSAVGENTTLLNNAIVVEHNNTKITVAANLYISISRLQEGAGNGYAGIRLTLKQITGGWGEALVASHGEFTENTVQNTYPVNKSFIVPAGTYKLEFSSTRGIGNPEVPFSLECRCLGGTLTAVFDGAKRVTEIGKNGMGVIADANNYSFFGVESGVYKIVEKTTGVYDRPGVLLAGRMESGSVSKYWGAKYRAGSYREGNNIYRIHHNIGHVDYSVQLTPQLDARMWVIQRATTYCRIQASVATLDFDFAMFGDNK